MGVWVKTILEAMVGVPLWALAHLRIDGNGLPGSAAMSGYYLVFEVFLRPICIVFGLLASIAIFGAQVKILHQIWPLVTSNMTGFEANSLTPPPPAGLGGTVWFRGIVDQFFFTLIYTFVVYMMALASFKLIDMVPDYIMRWMGASVATFGDIYKDEVGGMPSRFAIGVGAGMQQLGSAAGQGGKGLQLMLASAKSGGKS
jgi:conjugal transfer/type IV secretion protein DotA/TraY